MGKHAYLIVANSNFKVLEVCLKLLDDVRNDIFLQFDKKSKVSNEYRQKLKQMITKGDLYICNDMIINWAGRSQVAAVMKLLKNAVNKQNYDYIHFLQGSDLPIKSQNDIHSFFSLNKETQFVNVEKSRMKMAQGKCNYLHIFCHNRFFRKNKIVKALNVSFVKFQEFLKIKRNQDILLYQGSALFSITGDCANYLLSRVNEINKRFRFSLAADEVFIQTILMNSSYKDNIADIKEDSSSNARLIDRTRSAVKNSPHVWTISEFDYIINQPENICFARKFDENIDLEIVNKLYETFKF